MAQEGAPQGESPKDFERVKLRIDPNTHEQWYTDAEGKEVVLDEAGLAERARQQQDPDSDPADGFPKFEKGTAFETRPSKASPLEDGKARIRLLADSLRGTNTIDKSTHESAVEELSKAEDEDDLAAIEQALNEKTKDAKKPQPVVPFDTGEANKQPNEGKNKGRDAQRGGPLDKQRSRRDVLKNLVGAGPDTNTGPAKPESKPEAKKENADEKKGPEAAGGGEQPPKGPEKESESTESEPEAAPDDRQPGDYKINKRDYIGIKVKTVQEILHDKEDQLFFGEYLRGKDPNADAVLRRYYEGKPTEADTKFLNFARYEYSKLDHEYKELSHHLSDADVKAMIRRNESMHVLAGHLGGERGAAIMKHALRYTAMRDPSTFHGIEHAMHGAHAAKNSYLVKRAEKKLSGLAGKLGIERDDLDDAIDLSDKKTEAESLKYLEKQFRAKAGFGRRVADMFTDTFKVSIGGSSRDAAHNAIEDYRFAKKGHLGQTGKKLRQLDSQLKHAADNLTKVVGTEELRMQMAKETIENEKFRPGAEAGPETFKDARDRIEAVKPADIEKKLNAHIASLGDKWTSGGHAYQDSVMRDFKKKEEKKLQAGNGIWAWVLKILFGVKFEQAAAKAAGRPVHVH